MKTYPSGVWPVMITPYLTNGDVDYEGLEGITDWYISRQVSGLFATCQSSEIFTLSTKERAQIVESVVKKAHGRVPVIASGHVSTQTKDLLEEMKRMEDVGANAFVLISNRLAAQDEPDSAWLDRLGDILAKSTMDLGMYECPYPYKRLLNKQTITACAASGRFFFLKDTCCDEKEIKNRLQWVKGSPMKLFNANSATLLDSLKDGAAGFSGIMANFHPEVYVWLCRHPNHPKAQEVQNILTLTSLAENLQYPISAKYHLQAIEGISIELTSRVANEGLFTPLHKKSVHSIHQVIKALPQYIQEEI